MQFPPDGNNDNGEITIKHELVHTICLDKCGNLQPVKIKLQPAAAAAATAAKLTGFRDKPACVRDNWIVL